MCGEAEGRTTTRRRAKAAAPKRPRQKARGVVSSQQAALGAPAETDHDAAGRGGDVGSGGACHHQSAGLG